MTARDHARYQQGLRWHGRQGYYRIRPRRWYEQQHVVIMLDFMAEPSYKLRSLFTKIGKSIDTRCIDQWRAIAHTVKSRRSKQKWHAWVRQADYVFWALAWPEQDSQLKIIDTTT